MSAAGRGWPLSIQGKRGVYVVMAPIHRRPRPAIEEGWPGRPSGLPAALLQQPKIPTLNGVV
jgi:hypothetical protein